MKINKKKIRLPDTETILKAVIKNFYIAYILPFVLIAFELNFNLEPFFKSPSKDILWLVVVLIIYYCILLLCKIYIQNEINIISTKSDNTRDDHQNTNSHKDSSLDNNTSMSNEQLFAKNISILKLEHCTNNLDLIILKKQYRKLAKEYHPDLKDNLNSKDFSQDDFIRINEAYKYLKDYLTTTR